MGELWIAKLSKDAVVSIKNSAALWAESSDLVMDSIPIQ